MTRSHSVTLPDGLSDELQERAKRERRSFSSLVSFLIEAKLREIQLAEALNKRDGICSKDNHK